jgi:hypothetical protein
VTLKAVSLGGGMRSRVYCKSLDDSKLAKIVEPVAHIDALAFLLPGFAIQPPISVR